jgi:pimeloyl-[acyl-carrier protein] synthase
MHSASSMEGGIGAMDVDLSKTAELGEGLLERLNRLRETDPIHWSDASKAWLVLRNADVADGFAGKLPLVSHVFPEVFDLVLSRADQQKYIPETIRFTTPFSTNLDGADHRRLRPLLMKAVDKRTVEDLRPFVRRYIDGLLDGLKSTTVEFNEGIARDLAGAVILRLLGLPLSFQERLKGWSNAIMVALGANQPSLDRLQTMEQNIVEMRAIFETELEKRRIEPGPDVISALQKASQDEGALTHEEVIGTCVQFIVAGHESSTNSLSLGLVALARHPNQWDLLKKRPDLLGSAVNEMMRFSAMSTAMPRTAGRDFEWHGKRIKKGEGVILLMASANRDPRAFPNPDVLDITRGMATPVQTFGPGLHMCVGHFLAKMEMAEFFSSLVARFDGAEVLDSKLQFTSQLVFRGLDHLNIRLHRGPGKIA